MKRKSTLFLASLAMLASSAFAGGNYTYDLLGTTFQVDTMFHSKVGPGTTQTSLLFTGPSYNLRVFYLTVNLDAPTVKVRSVSGKDKMAGAETTSGMAQRRSIEGEQYFAGVNGDFWETGGTTLRGESRVGGPIAASIIDGEIFKTSEANVQFALDVNNVPYIGRASFVDNTATCGDRVTSFKGVNVWAYGDGITLYTSRYFSGSNEKQAGSAEVQARVADGYQFKAGVPCKFVVTSAPSTAGDMDIPADGFVIHGCGTSTAGGNTGAYDFVNSLKVGDVVTMTSKVTIDGVSIVPQQMISGSSITTANGETLMYTDDGSVHPRTGIGFSADGKKVIMMVIDGRSAISNGARTGQLSDIMRYAGASRAMNMDGGGSSTCYTQALGIRNVPSDGSERADANAIFAVCMAPTDKEIAEIRFVDWAMKFPKYGIYSPKIFGFNKYGLLIDTDVQGVKLSCPKELGVVKDDGTTFVGDGSGTHALTATYKGLTASIPVTIVASSELKMAHESIVNDGYRNYPVEVLSKVNDDFMKIDASALTWSSDDASVVEVDAQSGVLRGVNNGTTTVRGKVDDFEGAMNVVVEKPMARTMAIDPEIDPSTWTISQTGGTNGKIEALNDGFRYTYTGKSGRSPYIKLLKTLKMWSMPDTLRLRINPGSAQIKNIILAMQTANGKKETVKLTPEFKEGQATVVDLPMDTWCDPTDVGVYPISVNYVYFTMGASAAGTAYTIDSPEFVGVYGAFGGSGKVADIEVSAGFGVVKSDLEQGEPITLHFDKEGVANVVIYNAAGQKVDAEKLQVEAGEVTLRGNDLAAGVYFVGITQNGESRVDKIVIK